MPRDCNFCLNLQFTKRGQSWKDTMHTQSLLAPHGELSPTTLSPQTSKWPGRNPELHSLGVHINCQQSLKAITPISSPVGHTSHLFNAYLEWKLEPINAP